MLRIPDDWPVRFVFDYSARSDSLRLGIFHADEFRALLDWPQPVKWALEEWWEAYHLQPLRRQVGAWGSRCAGGFANRWPAGADLGQETSRCLRQMDKGHPPTVWPRCEAAPSRDGQASSRQNLAKRLITRSVHVKLRQYRQPIKGEKMKIPSIPAIAVAFLPLCFVSSANGDPVTRFTVVDSSPTSWVARGYRDYTGLHGVTGARVDFRAVAELRPWGRFRH
jgi:hypothetical protein